MQQAEAARPGPHSALILVVPEPWFWLVCFFVGLVGWHLVVLTQHPELSHDFAHLLELQPA